MDPYTRQLEEEVGQCRAALRTAQQDYNALAECALAYLRAKDALTGAHGRAVSDLAADCDRARAALLAMIGEDE